MQSWFSSEGSGVSDHPPRLNSTEGTNKLQEPGLSPGCVFDKRMIHPKELFRLSKYPAAGSVCHIGLQSLQSLKQGLSKKDFFKREKKNKNKNFCNANVKWQKSCNKEGVFLQDRKHFPLLKGKLHDANTVKTGYWLCLAYLGQL